jgi:hypothetical protein
MSSELQRKNIHKSKTREQESSVEITGSVQAKGFKGMGVAETTPTNRATDKRRTTRRKPIF